MERILKRIKTNVLVSSLLDIVIGAVLMIWPDMSLKAACIAIGAVLLAGGVTKLISYFFHRDDSLFSYINLIFGIIITLLGAWIMLQPDQILKMVPILVGIIIVIHGIQDLQQAVTLCKGKYEKWWMALILGLLTVGFGALLIWNPFTANEVFVRCIGFFLIYDGISNLWILSRVAYTEKQLDKAVKTLEEADHTAEDTEE